MGDVFQKFGEGMRKFPKKNIDGRNYGGRFPEIWRRDAQISKKTLLDYGGGNYGGFFQKFGKGMREFQKKQYWREEIMGEIFPEIWRRYARISKKHYWTIGGRKL